MSQVPNLAVIISFQAFIGFYHKADGCKGRFIPTSDQLISYI